MGLRLRLVLAIGMAVAAMSQAWAYDWATVATISDTVGVNSGHLCVGLTRGDIGCATNAPSLNANGDLTVYGNLNVSGSQIFQGVTFANGGVSATGTITATQFVGNGSGITGIDFSANPIDRIISGTYGVYVSNTGLITANGGVAATGAISATGLYISGTAGIGTAPTSVGLTMLGGISLDGVRISLNTTSGNFLIGRSNMGGTNNTSLGYGALNSTSTGGANVAIGNYAMQTNSTGANNTAIGYGAATYASGQRNTLVGRQAGVGSNGVSTYSDVVAVGSYAGSALTSGISNTILGANAARTLTTGSSNIIIGASVSPYSDTGSNQLNIGDSIFGNIRGALTSLIGINVTSPTAELEVSGTISGTRFVGDGSGLTGVTAASADRIISGTAQVIANGNTNSISITESGVTTGYYYNGQWVVGSISTTGAGKFNNVSVSTNVSVTGNLSAANFYGNGAGLTGLDFSANPLDRIISGTSNVIATTNASVTIATAGLQRVTIGTNGNVGISTTNPREKLTVDGSILLSADNSIRGNVYWDGASYRYYSAGYGQTMVMNSSLGYLIFGNTATSGAANAAATVLTRMVMDPSGKLAIGGGLYPSTTLDVSGTLKLANGGEACDTNRIGAIKYQSGSFYVCQSAVNGWESIATTGANSLADRITSGTTQVITNGSGNSISFTVGGVTTGYFYNGQLVASAVSTTGPGKFNDISSTNNASVGNNLTVGGHTVTANVSTTGDVSITGNLSAANFIGDGSRLTNISASNIVGLTADRITSGTSNITVNNNGNISLTVAGTEVGNLDTDAILTLNGALAGVTVSTGSSTYTNVTGGSVESVNPTNGTSGTSVTLSSDGGLSLVRSTNSGAGNINGYVDFRSESGSARLYYDTAAYGFHMYNSTNNVKLNLDNPTSAMGIGFSGTPSTSLHVSGTLRIANGGESCDANRLGAIKYQSGSFYICQDVSHDWEPLATLGAFSASDRITSGTTNVITNSPANSISFTVGGVTTGYFYNGQLVANGVSTTGAGKFNNVSVTTNADVGNNLTVGGHTVTANVSTTGDVSITGNLSAANFIGDGSQLTNISASNIQGLTADRITSGTTSVIANNNSNVSVTVGGNEIANISAAKFMVSGTAGVSGSLLVTGTANVTGVISTGAQFSQIIGSNNVALGRFTGTNGSQVTNVGIYAGQTSSANNTVNVGYTAGGSSSGNGVVFIGSGPGQNNVGANVVGIGTGTAQYNNSAYTVGMGSNVLQYNTGTSNTAVGPFAMQFKTTGADNVAIGANAGQGASTTTNYSRNTMLGSIAGNVLTTGSSNTLIGYKAGSGITTGNNNIILGASLDPFSNTGDNQLNIGNSIFGNIRGGLASLIGINVTSPTANLEVSGTISGTRFVGDGSGLTGVIAAGSDRIVSGTAKVIANGNTNSISITESGVTTGYYYNGIWVAGGVSTTGTISGTTGSFGRLIATAQTTLANVSSSANVSVTGNVSANKFIGDGSLLTGVTAGSADWYTLTSIPAQVQNVSNGTVVSLTLVSATNISATYVDATRNGTVSATNGYFRYVSGSIISGKFVGDGSSLTGVTAASADRIISGTAQVIANGNTNSISITESGVTTGYYYNGIWVAGGVSTTASISATRVFAGQRLETRGGIYFNQGSGATDNLMYLKKDGVGPVDASMGFFAAGVGSGGESDGPYFLARGNLFSAIANQRGNMYFSAGNPTSPNSKEGSLNFLTGAGVSRMIIDKDGNVGINSTGIVPNATLDVYGLISATNINTSGTVYASHFVGDGSGLTGVIAAGSDRITSGTAQVIANGNTNSISITESGVTTGYYYNGQWVVGSISTTGAGKFNNVSVTSNVSVTGNVSANKFIGDGSLLTGLATTNLSETIAINDLSDASASTAIHSLYLGSGTGGSSTATYNVGIGMSSLVNSTGTGNIAVGTNALQANTSGNYNVAISPWALQANTTGDSNVAIGPSALNYNTTGSNNVGVGENALSSNVSGNHNTGLGWQALNSNSTGTDNTATGYNAMGSNITGSTNVANGVYALYYPSAVTGTVAIGYNAGQGNGSTGYSYGTYVGTASGFSVTSGNYNTFLGAYSGDSVTTGAHNIVIGYDVDTPAPGVSDWLNIGNVISGSMTTGGSLTFIGGIKAGGIVTATYFEGNGSHLTGLATTNLSETIAINDLTDASASTAINSVFLGNGGGNHNTTGTQNTAVGDSAMAANTTGSQNAAFGQNALLNNTTGNNNLAVGAGSMLSNATGNTNTAVGASSFLNFTTGSANTVVGNSGLAFIRSGSNNAVLGASAGWGIGTTSLNNSVLIGYQAGYNISGTTSNNIFIGYQAGYNGGLGNNNLLIGPGVNVPTAASSYALNIGNTLFGDMTNATPAIGGAAKLGINWVTPTVALEVSGTVSATQFTGKFVGDGSGLTNLAAAFVADRIVSGTAQVIANGNTNSISITESGVTTGYYYNGQWVVGSISTTGAGKFNNVSVTSNVSVTGNVSANKFIGDGSLLTGLATTNLSETIAINDLSDASASIVKGSLYMGANVGNLSTGSYNTGVGISALTSNTTGVRNIAYGYQALFSNSTGSDNLAIGYQALYSNQTGYNNIANGSGALYSNTSGYYNIASGGNALYSNDTGHDNVAHGYGALYSNTSGYRNVAEGTNALNGNDTGAHNVATGYQALLNNTAGGGNVASGANALYYANSVTNTVAIGMNSGLGASGQTTFTNGTFVGYSSGLAITTGNANTFLGYYAGATTTTGSSNTLIGALAYAPTAGTSNWLNIANAISGSATTGGSMTFIGGIKANGIVTATYFEGDGSRLTNLASAFVADRIVSGTAQVIANGSTNSISITESGVTTGYYYGGQWVIGSISTTGAGKFNNVSVSTNVSVTGNVSAAKFIGDGSLLTGLATTNLSETIALNDLSDVSVSIVRGSMYLGNGVGNNTTATGNTAIGLGVLDNGGVGPLANSNTVVGYQALHDATGSIANTAFGTQALASVDGGINNVAVGYRSLATATGNGNTALGYGTSAGTGSYNLLLGYNVAPPASISSYGLNIGNSIFGTMANALSTGGAAKIGINTITPTTALDVSGSLKISNGGETCGAGKYGTMRVVGGVLSLCRQ